VGSASGKGAFTITSKIGDSLPEDLRWPVYEYRMQVTFAKIIPSTGTPAQGAPTGQHMAVEECDGRNAR
jgi:hypothetical protein